MKNIIKKKLTYLLIGGMLLGPLACKDSFLEVPVAGGQLDEQQATSRRGIEGLLIGAYAPLAGRGQGWYAGSSNWVWGSIRGGDANKGSNAGDQNLINPIQNYEVDPVNDLVNAKWAGMFEGVARTNMVIKSVQKSTDYTEEEKNQVLGEARFLRGHYYFELKKNFKNVPWIDENIDFDSGAGDVKNDTDIWPNIEADFLFAYQNLPETRSEVGRPNKWAAGAYLGKTYLFEKKYPEAKPVFDSVIVKGVTSDGKKYDLLPNYAMMFNADFDNSAESVFAIQSAVNVGSVEQSNQDFVLNFPYNTGSSGPAGCCGFYQPSFELTNSFRTDPVTGLPLLDESYRLPANEIRSDQGILSKEEFLVDNKPVDPRLDHSVGRRGIPYLDWIVHPGNDWIRDQSYAGPYSPKKFVFYKSQQGKLTDGSSWTSGYTATNFPIIRFADVLLLAAEVEVELGNLEQARTYVNRVRERAAKPESFVKGKVVNYEKKDGETLYNKPIVDLKQDAANYKIGLYNTPWTDPAMALRAVQFERKLELNQEGHRFYDLVRWGIDDEQIPEYINYESSKLRNLLTGAKYEPNKDEFLPIPQRQIDLQGKDVLAQDPAYQ